MIEKIPSLKDFIIYVIPGILICYFSLNIVSWFLNDNVSITADVISKSTSLTFISIIFSFLVGFIFSQIQIITYNLFLRHRNRRIRTIEGTSLNKELKKKIAFQVKKSFKMTSSEQEILNDNQVIYLCVNYIKINQKNDSIGSINRSGNLSTFASSVPIPIMLGIWNLCLRLDLPMSLTCIVLSISIGLLLTLTTTIVLNFRKDWVNNTFRQFYILSIN